MSVPTLKTSDQPQRTPMAEDVREILMQNRRILAMNEVLLKKLLRLPDRITVNTSKIDLDELLKNHP